MRHDITVGGYLSVYAYVHLHIYIYMLMHMYLYICMFHTYQYRTFMLCVRFVFLLCTVVRDPVAL